MDYFEDIIHKLTSLNRKLTLNLFIFLLLQNCLFSI